MPSQYQLRQFFRQVPNELLSLYFESSEVELYVDFENLGETQVEPIFKAFITLPEDQQADMDKDFQDINVLASDSGIAALRDEAKFYGDETFPEEISNITGLHAKSMWAFLHKPKIWKGAAHLQHVGNGTCHFWKKINGLPKVPPHVDEEDIGRLGDAVSNYFHKIEGRGRNCKVEVYDEVKTGKVHLYAYLEDYGQSGMEWERNDLAISSRHSAFEIIFVNCQGEGSLDIYAPKNTKAVPELQKIFAKNILKLDTLADCTIGKRVYNLNILAKPDFEFQPPAEAGISEVIVTKLRVSLMDTMVRIELEADTKQNNMAVYDLLEKLKLRSYHITQASIKVVFKARPGKCSWSKTFTVTYPNTCNLNHHGYDAIIRHMLTATGIDSGEDD
ncbi:MAG: hypothetical protein ABW087_21240 [Candidatus Thiodiazotropha sp.]